MKSQKSNTAEEDSASKPEAKPGAGEAKPAKAQKGEKAAPVLLSGGNPQIAKGDGDAPVQAYIAAMPGWKSKLGNTGARPQSDPVPVRVRLSIAFDRSLSRSSSHLQPILLGAHLPLRRIQDDPQLGLHCLLQRFWLVFGQNPIRPSPRPSSNVAQWLASPGRRRMGQFWNPYLPHSSRVCS